MNIITLALDMAKAVETFMQKAKRFFYSVMLLGHRCPKCNGSLVMVSEGKCRCASCGKVLDPTVTFQRCSACGGVGRPPKKPIVLYHSFRYQAASWNIPRRVVAKIGWNAGELFPRVNFIVTNLRWRSSNVVKFYNKRGTAEQCIKEGKYALNWTRLSCHDFVDNQVRLQLFALAYNLGNFLRRI
jgi:hypothetical protein